MPLPVREKQQTGDLRQGCFDDGVGAAEAGGQQGDKRYKG